MFRNTEILENDQVIVMVEIYQGGEVKKFHGIGTNRVNAKLAASKLALRHIHKPDII